MRSSAVSGLKYIGTGSLSWACCSILQCFSGLHFLAFLQVNDVCLGQASVQKALPICWYKSSYAKCRLILIHGNVNVE